MNNQKQLETKLRSLDIQIKSLNEQMRNNRCRMSDLVDTRKDVKKELNQFNL